MNPNVNGGPDGTADEEAFRPVIEQLSYLVDELSAQRPLFSKISDSILSERPINEEKSIKDHFLEILVRENSVNQVIVSGLISGDLRGQSVDDLLLRKKPKESDLASVVEIQEKISQSRRAVVELLLEAPADAWSAYVMEKGQRQTLHEWAFRMGLEDADTLREISTMLSEIQLIFRR